MGDVTTIFIFYIIFFKGDLEKNFYTNGTFVTFTTNQHPTLMKKHFLILFLASLTLVSCDQEGAFTVAKNESKQSPLSILQENNANWRYENLRLYPVLASTESIASNATLQHLKTLSEAMQKPGFRVLEQKQFGRGDQPWYHGLTVQNKTQDTVLLFSGDIVKGGNQDRVIAHHEVIMPMTVRNIEVFCVEAGRSSYNPAAPAAEKQAAAFKGYYNMASPAVRHAVQNTGNQQDVWDAVAKVTKANNAESSTRAYTALDQESDQKAKRDTYLQHLGGQFSDKPDIVGVVAVCGNKVLSVDIFGTPDLFRRQYQALLHGYIAEAAAAPPTTEPFIEARVIDAFEKVSKLSAKTAKSNEEAGKFSWGGSWVHLYGQ